LLNSGNYSENNRIKYWREYYYYTLKNLSFDYKENYRKHGYRDIEWPYYYYKVLIEECELCQEYKFEGMLLEGLIKLFLCEKYEKKIALYKQVFRLNYIESKADFINSIESSREEVKDIKNKEIQQYLDNLLKSENRIIAEHILKGNLFCTKDNVVDYAIVFLEPLFKKHLAAWVKEDLFRERFREVLNLDCVSGKLIVQKGNSKIEKDTLQIKTLMNIIGILLNEYHNGRNPIKVESSDIISTLITMWRMDKLTGYTRYISGYNSWTDNPKSHTTVFGRNEIQLIHGKFMQPYKNT